MSKNHEAIQLELRKFVCPEYIFGLNARELAAGYCQKLGADKVLLVTDEGLQQTKWYSELIKSLTNIQIDFTIYSEVTANPKAEEVMLGTSVYEENRCNLILALGGGSVIDCAKGIGIVAANKQSIAIFEGVDKIPIPIPPLICIPTTAGTSADVSQFAIINNTDERYKMAIVSKALVPDVSLIDPEVLTTMDELLTAHTGMDALCHAFEAFASNASSPFTDLYALEAVRLIKDNLVECMANPNDMQLRGKTMLASLYAGLAFSNASLGCTHSMAHSLGGYLDYPHGECNAILLPHVVSYNFNYATEKYSKIADAFGLDIRKMPDIQIKNELINKLFQLKKDLKIDYSLNNMGVTSDIVGILAEKAIHDPCNATNPRTPTVEDLKMIFLEAV